MTQLIAESGYQGWLKNTESPNPTTRWLVNFQPVARGLRAEGQDDLAPKHSEGFPAEILEA